MPFNGLPKITRPRSHFNDTFDNFTTFNNGKLIPICDPIETMPGGTYKFNLSALVRENTLLNPVMDRLELNIWAAYVPFRLIWENYARFLGANDDGAYVSDETYVMPKIVIPDAREIKTGSLLDYLGIPVQTPDGARTYNALPLRAYYKVWNDHFRFAPLQKPVLEAVNDANTTYAGLDPLGSTLTGANKGNWQSDNTGCWPLPVCKKPDYFTTCLPQPQATESGVAGVPLPGIFGNTTEEGINDPFKIAYKEDEGSFILQPTNVLESTYLGIDTTESAYGGVLVGNAEMATISGLRYQIAMQQYLENDNIYGFKNEKQITMAHFGVDTGDARVQLSEIFGHDTIILRQTQVAQTAPTTDGTTPQANLAAYGHTSQSGMVYTYSARERGIILILAATRTNHTYTQGVNKFYLKEKLHDLYSPEFDGISDQPVLQKEIYDIGTGSQTAIFGYQESWADYRHHQSRATGYMRTDITGSLDTWTYADAYGIDAPTLSNLWIQEPVENVDRTLALQSGSGVHQFFGEFAITLDSYLPMSMYGKPGLARI